MRLYILRIALVLLGAIGSDRVYRGIVKRYDGRLHYVSAAYRKGIDREHEARRRLDVLYVICDRCGLFAVGRRYRNDVFAIGEVKSKAGLFGVVPVDRNVRSVESDL
ncbi:unknown [Anaerotruncus sp. CAG:390]|nr:unknown [Anaerotruncus sp. CAG:390]